MMASVAEQLHQVQLLDTQLSEQQSKLRESEGLLGESQELLKARRSYEKARSDCDTWTAQLKDLEFELHRLVERIAKTEERLYGGQVGNPKELNALQQDHEYLQRARGKLEEDVLLAMTHTEGCEERVATTSKALADVECSWRDEQCRLTTKVEGLRSKVATLKTKRQALVGTLSPADISMYEELVRLKGGRAVVLLVRQMCQGCRVTLPSGKAQAVRRSQDIVTCPNCGRILVAER